MPIGSWGAGDSPLLSGLFGVFQSMAAQYADTATIWTTLRVNAAVQANQFTGGGENPSISELEAQGAQILKSQGVDAIQVGLYRSLAGQWRTAKANLTGADQRQQITGAMIFQPPWAQTLDDSVPSRYRMRVEWQGEDAVGTPFTTWGTYEMGTPLTSIEDALARARTLVGKVPTSDMPPGASIVGINDYEMEQI